MADVVLSITIPDAWRTTTLAAFTAVVGASMTLQSSNGLNTQWTFTIPAQGGLTDRQFCEKVFRELGEAVVNMVDIDADRTRYNTELAALTPPASDVPDNIFI